MKRKRLIKQTVALSLITSAFYLTTGCDDTYDIQNISGEMQLFGNGLTAPIGNTTQFYLSEFIDDDDILIVRDGQYAIQFNGNSATTLSIPSVETNPIAPTFEDANINFLESINRLPGIKEALDAAGYTSGPLPQLNIEISDITTSISETTEQFTLDIPDVPAEILGIYSIKPAPQTILTVKLHSDEFPKQITQAKFDFSFRIPQQLVIEPLQNDVILDGNGMMHISRYVHCNNGSFSEDIPFIIHSADFDPAAMRQPDGTITIGTDFTYYGTVDIDESFNISGWDPDLAISIGIESKAIQISEVSARIAKSIDPIEYTYELSDLPDFLQDENTCLDLTSIMIDLTVGNNTPGLLETGIKLQSEFLDGSTSANGIETSQPIIIDPLSTQDAIITNDEAYAGTPGYIPGLETLMYRVPRIIKIYASPRIPESDVTIALNTDYKIDLDYDFNVPITFGNDFSLYFEDVFPDMDFDFTSISDATTSFDIEGDAINTIPIDLTMALTPLDAEGNVMESLVISEIATLRSNATTHFALTIEDHSNGALQKLDAIRFSVSGTASNGGELNPEQYIQFKNLKIALPDGFKIQD